VSESTHRHLLPDLVSIRAVALLAPDPARTFLRQFAALAIVPLLLAACSALEVDGQNLEGTTWKAVSVAGQPPIVGSEPTIVFDPQGVHGSSGCNGYTGQKPASIWNGNLKLGEMLLTLGACVGSDSRDLPVMAVEQTFWTMLNADDRIAIRGSQLVISGSAGELVFDRQP
jgi:heat shock protein HslJ